MLNAVERNRDEFYSTQQVATCSTALTNLDCKQSLSGQSRWCAHSAGRLERGEINGKRLGERRKTFLFLSPFSRLSPSPPPLVRSSFFALGYFARPRLSRKGLLAVYNQSFSSLKKLMTHDLTSCNICSSDVEPCVTSFRSLHSLNIYEILLVLKNMHTIRLRLT